MEAMLARLHGDNAAVGSLESPHYGEGFNDPAFSDLVVRLIITPGPDNSVPVKASKLAGTSEGGASIPLVLEDSASSQGGPSVPLVPLDMASIIAEGLAGGFADSPPPTETLQKHSDDALNILPMSDMAPITSTAASDSAREGLPKDADLAQASSEAGAAASAPVIILSEAESMEVTVPVAALDSAHVIIPAAGGHSEAPSLTGAASLDVAEGAPASKAERATSSSPDAPPVLPSIDIHVCKLILAGESDFFRASFKTALGVNEGESRPASNDDDSESTDHKEKKRKVQGLDKGVLLLEVPSIEVGTELLRYPYYRQLSDTFSDVLSLVQLLVCADEYIMPRLWDKCLNWLEETVTNASEASVVRSYLPSSLLENSKRLKSFLLKCSRLIAMELYPTTTAIMEKDEQFLSEPFGIIRVIMSENWFKTQSEENLMRCVIHWFMGNTSNDTTKTIGWTSSFAHFEGMSSSFLIALCRIPGLADAATFAFAHQCTGEDIFTLTKYEVMYFARQFSEGTRPTEQPFVLLSLQVQGSLVKDEIKRAKDYSGGLGVEDLVLGQGNVTLVQGFFFRLKLQWGFQYDGVRKLYVKVVREADETAHVCKLLNPTDVVVKTRLIEPPQAQGNKDARVERLRCGDEGGEFLILGSDDSEDPEGQVSSNLDSLLVDGDLIVQVKLKVL
eukprot:TRINITY_DN2777_c3_g2_i1.p1 TRINITY_DN2777_c3_g2~~TRINITY_DN2777_c3_g2_i1.p1  ORF type:complete len:676 (+),score=89.89 TRINITY_DN2777_c3_g2_i1:1983-4010(+)